MAGFITAEGLVVAAGADTYDYVNDQRRLAGSIRSVVPAADNAGVATIVAAMNTDGRPVTDTNPLIASNIAEKGLQLVGSSGTIRPASPQLIFAHAGKSNGFTAGNLNPVPITAQILRGGMTLVSNGIVVPISGLYRVTAKGYSSGAPTGLCILAVNQNAAFTGASVQWTKTQTDEYMTCSAVHTMAAGDNISLAMNQPASIYGADGYNGTWLEVEYLGAP